ncbi:MAG: DUF5916 domain-containing protein [Bacteroidota bacterium]
MKAPTILTILLCCFSIGFAQEDDQKTTDAPIEKKVYTTKAIEGEPPKIDGILDDPIWETVEWGGDFTQWQPYEKEAPTQETSFKILYDDKTLYVAFRCHDQEPAKIVKRMSRRDGFEGDWVEINIDSYFDQRTAFSFTASVSGVKGDEFISNNGRNWDGSWNPIWYLRTNIDDEGWTAEVAIPLSQLRFGNKEEHVWGLQFTRRDFREESRSLWQFVPRSNNNWVSEFGELRGIKGIKSQKQVEIQPYVLGQLETFEKEEGNPFADGFDQKATVGLDAKIGVTSDLTLDLTINPDFGQVEADPSVVTLDGFRVFFGERRPFFIENRNVFEFRLASANAGGNFTTDRIFYSRRIGGAPNGYPDLDDVEYSTQPDNTSILGATKFSGKTKNGLSIGILEAVTSKEFAKIDSLGERSKELVEPLTNFLVGRITKDINEGNTVIGGMFTATNRWLEEPSLEFLHKSAYSGGLDFTHRWADRSWYVTGSGVFSNVSGTTEAITNTQLSFEHNFDRPDADHLDLDTTLTSLFGHNATLKIGKSGGKNNFSFETGMTYRSPKLELNDIGFMTNSDDINHFFWAGYRFNKPFSVFRQLGVNYNHWARWDFGGNPLYRSVNVNANANFKNFWNTGVGLNFDLLDVSNNFLRGGPALKKPNGAAVNFWLGTDQRKPISTNLSTFHAWGYNNSVKYESYWVNIRVQPTNALNFWLSPNFSRNQRTVQYVTNLEYNGDQRYINATVDQQTLSMSVRLNYTILPNLTLQYYGQPFISRGNYSEFKHIVDPMWDNFDDSYVLLNTTYDENDEVYYVDENGDSIADYNFDNPDFNFIQFRSNLVARWEYIPGSEVFFVWSQGATNFGDPNEGLFKSLGDNLFSGNFRNIFLVKFTYRFIL